MDAQPYFDAFASAVAQAQRSVLIAGWDIDSRVELWRDERQMGLPRRLGDFLNAVASRREDLHVHVLAWDFAMIYALEHREVPREHVDVKVLAARGHGVKEIAEAPGKAHLALVPP